MALSLGALARREYLERKPYGFHPFRAFPLVVRASFLKRAAGDDAVVRIKFELQFSDASLKGKRIEASRIIEWWRLDGYEEVIAGYLAREPYDLIESRQFIVNGFGDPVD